VASVVPNEDIDSQRVKELIASTNWLKTTNLIGMGRKA